MFTRAVSTQRDHLVFPVFGATTPQIAMLPLVFIVCVTALKDGIEDYRRAVLDEEVNISATTKLGQWRNVNVAADPRSWFEKLLGLNPPGRVTKGVRRLREKEAGEGMRVVLRKDSDVDGDKASISTRGMNSNSLDMRYGHGDNRLEDIQSVDSHSYPPNAHSETSIDSRSFSFDGDRTQPPNILAQLGSLANNSAYQQSVRSQGDAGVIDWRKRALGSASWERTLWKKLEVGDIVLLRDNEQIPADIAVLSTSDPNSMCYVETKNLDGETNLKPRKAVRGTSSIVSEEDLERSSFVLDSEPPHQNLYLYNGVLRYTDPASGEQRREAVTINELLLRGCTVRNTSWVIGLVVFTGSDTKIMLNGGDTPSKRSKIEKETNFNVIVNFVVLILMCTIAAIVNGVSDNDEKTSRDFYEIDSNPSSSSVLNALVTFV
jgi:phospholipid-translocating ATPase